jgi:hypothetical protein
MQSDPAAADRSAMDWLTCYITDWTPGADRHKKKRDSYVSTAAKILGRSEPRALDSGAGIVDYRPVLL